MRTSWLIGVALVLAGPGLASAQSRPAEASPAPVVVQEEAAFDLPVSVARIHRLLRTSRSTDAISLRLDYYVEVYGKAIRFDRLFPEASLAPGPVPYAGVTHREFMALHTIEEFKSPAMDLSNAARVIWQGR